jgi:hypothetical protein
MGIVVTVSNNEALRYSRVYIEAESTIRSCPIFLLIAVAPCLCKHEQKNSLSLGTFRSLAALPDVKAEKT